MRKKIIKVRGIVPRDGKRTNMTPEDLLKKVGQEVKVLMADQEDKKFFRVIEHSVPVPSVMVDHEKGRVHKKILPDEQIMKCFEAHDLNGNYGDTYRCNAHVFVKIDDTPYTVEALAKTRALDICPKLKYTDWRLFRYDEHGTLQPFGDVVKAAAVLDAAEERKIQEVKDAEAAKRNRAYTMRKITTEAIRKQADGEMSQTELDEYRAIASKYRARAEFIRKVEAYVRDLKQGRCPGRTRKRNIVLRRDCLIEASIITEAEATEICKDLGF